MPGQKLETGHEDVVHDVSMDYYGRRVATASSDTTVKIISVSASGSRPLATLKGHYGPVWQVAWAHPKFGSMVASCSYDGQVIIWKEETHNEWSQFRVFNESKSSANSISWAPSELGLSLACASSDGSIVVYTAQPDGSWGASRIERAHPVGATSVSWAPATGLVGGDLVRKMVSGGCDNAVKIWREERGVWGLDTCLGGEIHQDWVRDVAWAPSVGNAKWRIASGSQDGVVAVWSAGRGEQWVGKVVNAFGGCVWRVTWSSTGSLLAVADGAGSVTLWKEGEDGEWRQENLIET